MFALSLRLPKVTQQAPDQPGLCFKYLPPNESNSKTKKLFTMLKTVLEMSNDIPSRYENDIVRINETMECQSLEFKKGSYFLSTFMSMRFGSQTALN